MHQLLVFAQVSSGTNASALLAALFPFILMFIVLYFLLLRPQKKQEEQRRKLIESVKKGDKIITIGGIYGTVVSAKEDELIVRIDPTKDVCVKFTRSAVSRVIGSEKSVEQRTEGGKS